MSFAYLNTVRKTETTLIAGLPRSPSDRDGLEPTLPGCGRARREVGVCVQPSGSVVVCTRAFATQLAMGLLSLLIVENTVSDKK